MIQVKKKIKKTIKYCHNLYLDLTKGSLRSGILLQNNIYNFCNLMKGDQPGRYKYSSANPETVWASAFAALTLNLIGKISVLPDYEKKEWIKYFQSFQDEKTGIFIDPRFNDADMKSNIHSKELFLLHSSTFIMGALIVLGGKPLYPISWTHKYREPSKMKEWIEGLPWHLTPWVVGNWSYDIGCAMGMDYLVTKDDRNLEGMQAYFDWYDEHQLNETGWWDLTGKTSIEEQQYGGYHTLMIYRLFSRPILMADRMIETSLSIQKIDGLFGIRLGGGGCCEDMDIIDVLVSLGQATGYKKEYIKSSLEKAFYPLLRKQNSDGGFCNKLDTSRTEFGWKFCYSKRGESDLCSTLFQAFSISLIADFLHDEKIMNANWNHHKTYCHCEKNQPIIG